MAAASATVLSVLLSDGGREIVAGEVVIDAGVTFQELQFRIGDMIGVSAHQINLYLLRRRSARSGRQPPAAQIRTKTPIGEGTDFAALAREEGCAVVAQIRGKVKDKQGRGRRDRGGGGKADPPSGKKRGHPQPEKSALRRAVGFPVPHGASAASILPVAEERGAVVAGLFQYQVLRELQRQRERYLPAAGYYSGLHGHEAAAAAAVCEVCSRAAGQRGAAAFHWCVHDRVVAEAFRSAAGPIERPLKGRVPASA